MGKTCFFLFLMAGSCGVAASQERPTRGPADILQRAEIYLAQELAAQANRYRSPGQETMIATGTLEMDGKTLPVTLVRDIRGRVRVQNGSKQLIFDGRASRVAGASDNTDDEVLELVVGDSLEGLAARVAEGAALRLIGREFDVNGYAAISPPTKRYDVFASRYVPAERLSKGEVNKFYYFDSDTHDLKLVRDIRSDGGEVLTIYHYWDRSQTVPVPMDVERRINGKTIMRIRASVVQFAPEAADGTFE